jgi:uncharacterized repeat protein (TIGR03803 family)
MRGAAALAMLSVLLLMIAFQPAHAQTETVLYSFGSQAGDGQNPLAGLVMDKTGNLYGTTPYGGGHKVRPCLSQGCGTVFEVTPAGKETVLYSFCSQPDCTDGFIPYAGLVMDTVGNFYGTTYSWPCSLGYNCGTVFQVTPSGTETVLHSFCSRCADGKTPRAGLIMDMSGNLYGTTYAGGAYGWGTVFKVTPSGIETVLHSFGSLGDGFSSYAGLIMDTTGNLYGTTSNGYCPGGTSQGCGTVFQVTPSGTETVLYRFCSQQYCTDGAQPQAGLVMDAVGNLYGTTYAGGNNSKTGTVYKLTPSGIETVLYSFCSQRYCTDGAQPQAGLVMDKTGNLYGTTGQGGVPSRYCPEGCGTVFQVTPSGKETVLYSFCGKRGCADGMTPRAGLIMDMSGNLYGTTYAGGAYGWGTVFKVTP